MSCALAAAVLLGLVGCVSSYGAAKARDEASGLTVTRKEKPKMMWCHACGMSLGIPGFKGKSDIYCSHCTDKDGNLNVTREEVQRAMANWFKGWHPNIDDEKAMTRADHYLRAMPQWATD
jgi:hypothetical protein